MNINYENLIIYHCKNKSEYGLEFIKNIIDHYGNNEDLLIISLIYNNYAVLKYVLSLQVVTHAKDEVFKKACSDNNIEAVKIYNEHDGFKYRYTIEDDCIQGTINLLAKIKNINFEDLCCVCYDDSTCKTNCNHEMCVRCYKEIYLQMGICPLCRMSIEFCYIREKVEI